MSGDKKKSKSKKNRVIEINETVDGNSAPKNPSTSPYTARTFTTTSNSASNPGKPFQIHYVENENQSEKKSTIEPSLNVQYATKIERKNLTILDEYAKIDAEVQDIIKNIEGFNTSLENKEQKEIEIYNRIIKLDASINNLDFPKEKTEFHENEILVIKQKIESLKYFQTQAVKKDYVIESLLQPFNQALSLVQQQYTKILESLTPTINLKESIETLATLEKKLTEQQIAIKQKNLQSFSSQLSGFYVETKFKITTVSFYCSEFLHFQKQFIGIAENKNSKKAIEELNALSTKASCDLIPAELAVEKKQFQNLREKFIVSICEASLHMIQQQYDTIIQKIATRDKDNTIQPQEMENELVKLENELNTILLDNISFNLRLAKENLISTFYELKNKITLTIFQIQLDQRRQEMYESNNQKFGFFTQPKENEVALDDKLKQRTILSSKLQTLKQDIFDAQNKIERDTLILIDDPNIRISDASYKSDWQMLIDKTDQTIETNQKIETRYELHKNNISSKNKNVHEKISSLLFKLLADQNLIDLKARIAKIPSDDSNLKKRTKKIKFESFYNKLENISHAPSDTMNIDKLNLLKDLINDSTYYNSITANTGGGWITPESKGYFDKFKTHANELIETVKKEIEAPQAGYSPGRGLGSS